MHPPKLTDLSIAALLQRVELELQDIKQTINSEPTLAKQRCIRRDLLEVLKTTEQARFSASYGMGISDAAKLSATLPKEVGRLPTRR
jgi:hypothetical protein